MVITCTVVKTKGSGNCPPCDEVTPTQKLHGKGSTWRGYFSGIACSKQHYLMLSCRQFLWRKTAQ